MRYAPPNAPSVCFFGDGDGFVGHVSKKFPGGRLGTPRAPLGVVSWQWWRLRLPCVEKAFWGGYAPPDPTLTTVFFCS